MSQIQIKIQSLHPDAIFPMYQSNQAACVDLHVVGLEAPVTIQEGHSATFRTGVAVELPDGYALMIYGRSGHGFKNGVRLANVVGVIDADYRGEVMVRLHADYQVGLTGTSREHQCLTVKNGDRIAQAMAIAVPRIQFLPVSELGESKRGKGGFGSTGQ